MAIKAIWFDLDNTLINSRPDNVYVPAKHKTHEYFVRQSGQDISFENFSAKYEEVINNRGGRTGPDKLIFNRLIYFKHLVDLLLERSDPKLTLGMYKVFETEVMRNVRTNPGAIEILKTLKMSGYQIMILTIGSVQMKFEKLITAGLDDLIDFAYISEEMGVVKPAKEYFQYVLDKHNLETNEVVMVGDSLVDDIETPKAMGIKTILMEVDFKPLNTADNGSVGITPDFSIKNLSEIPDIIHKIENA